MAKTPQVLRVKGMHKKRKAILNISFLIITSFFLFFTGSVSLANNLSISNVSLEDRDPGADTVVVEFDVSWDNSWRDDVNHDAVWVFVKACEETCDDYGGGGEGYEHANLKTAGLNPADTDPGSNEDLDIKVPSDKVGAFLRRKTAGTGTFQSIGVRLAVDYSSFGASDSDQILLKVFGIEMVYIPEGSYDLGDGGSSRNFRLPGINNPVTITSDSVIVKVAVNADDDDQLETAVRIDGNKGLDNDYDGSIDNWRYPTGYKAFYLMKYELSQEQWRDFFNILTPDQQDNRCDAVLSGNDANDYIMVAEGQTTVDARQTIKPLSDPDAGEEYEVVCDLDDDDTGNEFNDGQWIAMNHIHWMDACAYADWAGLRPMTELEFEKAARGPTTAVSGEYAWGSTDLTQAEKPIVNSGEGVEVATTTGDGLCNYDGAGTDIEGPLRVGFAATGSTNRVSSGAGYYGNMELSGNLQEHAISLGQYKGRTYAGTHGDGTLTTAAGNEGNATNVDWPGINNTTAYGVNSSFGGGRRGGYYNSANTYLSISDRVTASSYSSARNAYKTFRCARTEPLETYQVQIRHPGTIINELSAGVAFWNNTSDADYSDNNYATVILSKNSSRYLLATDFGFDIPSSATVVAIVAEFERSAAAPGGQDTEVVLYIDGAINGSDASCSDKSTGEAFPTSDRWFYYGGDGSGSSPLWDCSSSMTTPANINNDSNFGVAIRASASVGATVYVDQIRMIVYYTE